jgi:hypothetical protein
MKIGLIIYGRLQTLSGGYLYDRQLVEHLEAAGDEVEIISLPWEGYGRSLLHNVWFALAEQLRLAEFDLLLQDELNHPSLFWLNRRLRGHISYPIVSIVHHLRSSEAAPKLAKLALPAGRTALPGLGRWLHLQQPDDAPGGAIAGGRCPAARGRLPGGRSVSDHPHASAGCRPCPTARAAAAAVCGQSDRAQRAARFARSGGRFAHRGVGAGRGGRYGRHPSLHAANPAAHHPAWPGAQHHLARPAQR